MNAMPPQRFPRGGWRGGHGAGFHPWLTSVGMLVSVLMLTMVAMTIPPLQSPDEPDHVRRAYLLGHGQLLLETPEDQMSGGWVDVALTEYLVPYHKLSFVVGQPPAKLSAEQVEYLGDIEWSGERDSYAILPGTGYYFPAIYLPQALGLRLGELTGQTIETSYLMARLAALLASVALLAAAVRHCPVSPLAAALLLLPMTVFQGVSASIDGVANGLLLLAVSLFLSMWRQSAQAMHAPVPPTRALTGLCLCVFLLVTCRYQLAGLLLLPFVLAWRLRSRAALLLGLATVAATVAWTAWALGVTVDYRVEVGASASTIILHYFSAPLEFAKVFYRSWADAELRQLYYESFLGLLAALDVRYNDAQYLLMSGLLIMALLMSIDLRNWRQDWPARAALLFAGLAAVPLAFFAMLISWTPHPADVVYGIQGRYFLGAALMLAYGLAAPAYQHRSAGLTLAAWLPAVFLAVFSALTIPGLMLERFYLQ